MQFCPKCGSLLIKKQKYFGCSRCDYTTKEEISMTMKEENKEKVSIAVIDKEKEANVNPITDFECPKCKNNKAYFWTQQMRSGDEPESKFFKCTKCETTTRVD